MRIGPLPRVAGLLVAAALPACNPPPPQLGEIRFSMPADGFASIQIKTADGHLARTLATARAFTKGTQSLVWNGQDDSGQSVPPGEYVWSGATHTGIRAKLHGWACADFGTPWRPPGGAPQWGGDEGVPSAVAADAERVYLGWSGARSGSAVLACDLDGQPLWGWRDQSMDRLIPGGTGITALAVDAGVVTVLKAARGLAIGGYDLIKLDAATGQPIPWPDNRRLNIRDLWPADGKESPLLADGMAARAGHIYLTFTEAQFLAVLNAQTGAYLQTVVGAPPKLIDAVSTKAESTDKPGELMDADFALVSLRGGVLGKVLFAHDPLWVMTSEMLPLDREERITALSVIGDGANFHQHSVFVGLGAPFHQVQRRAILKTEGFLWSAGHAGGRQPGPWVPEALGPIGGVALDARGRLWVAESAGCPPRFSVWETTGTEGRLVREFFGPASWGGIAVFPGDPDIFVGAGCEWRIDSKTGQARCLGVISGENDRLLGFVRTAPGRYELIVEKSGEERIRFERVGEGCYELRPGGAGAALFPREEAKFNGGCIGEATPGAGAGVLRFIRANETLLVVTANDLVLGRLFRASGYSIGEEELRGFRPPEAVPGMDFTEGPLGGSSSSQVTQATDGRVFFATAEAGFWTTEITGLDSIRSLPGGTLTMRAAQR